MNKKSDISSSVMKRVRVYEQEHTVRWMRLFFIVLFGLIGFIFALFGHIIYQMYVLHTFDMMDLVSEDWEVISGYWEEVLSTIVFEVSMENIAVFALFLMLLCIFIVVTHKKRKKIQRIMNQLDLGWYNKSTKDKEEIHE